MAIQTRYTKNGFSFDCEDHITPEFQGAYDYVAEHYPVLVYPIEMGVKQSVTDSYASKTKPAEIEGSGVKKFIAIMTGTVRVAGKAERVPTKTPMEKEIWRLATAEMVPVFAKNEKAGNAVPKDRQAHYVGLYIDRERERLTELVMAKISIGEKAEDDLESLFAVMEDESEDDDESDADRDEPDESQS